MWHIVCLVTHAYLKLPFIFYLLIHHYNLMVFKSNLKQIVPRNTIEFSSYKEKVLFFINQIIIHLGHNSQLSKYI